MVETELCKLREQGGSRSGSNYRLAITIFQIFGRSRFCLFCSILDVLFNEIEISNMITISPNNDPFRYRWLKTGEHSWAILGAAVLVVVKTLELLLVPLEASAASTLQLAGGMRSTMRCERKGYLRAGWSYVASSLPSLFPTNHSKENIILLYARAVLYIVLCTTWPTC